jgi:hypothetical protein
MHVNGHQSELRSVVPPTPGEAAAVSVRWERRGVLGRLVRIGDPPADLIEFSRRSR